MNDSHNSTSSVGAEKNNEVTLPSTLESEVGRALTNEIGDTNAYYIVIVDRGGAEVTFELWVSLPFLSGYLETIKPQRESKNKIYKKPRIIHKHIIRTTRESFKSTDEEWL